MTKNRGYVPPTTIPLHVPEIGGSGGQQMSFQALLEKVMNSYQTMTIEHDEFRKVLQEFAQRLAFVETRISALENKYNVIPSKIEVVVKHE